MLSTYGNTFTIDITTNKTNIILMLKSIFSYVVSFIVQFQIYKGTCILAGEYDPNNSSRIALSDCDIYQSTEAGNALK